MYFRTVNESKTGTRKNDTIARADSGEDQALRHLAAERYDASIKCFTDEIRLDYHKAEHHIGRALAYTRRGDYPMAVGDFTTAISIDPGSAAAYRGRGLTYSRLGNYEQAMMDQDEAIRLDPLNMGAHLGRDAARFLKASYDGTIAVLLRARQGRTAPPTVAQLGDNDLVSCRLLHESDSEIAARVVVRHHRQIGREFRGRSMAWRRITVGPVWEPSGCAARGGALSSSARFPVGTTKGFRPKPANLREKASRSLRVPL